MSTYNDWIKSQPEEFKREVLKESTIKAIDSGEKVLDRFVDENYKPMTLDELKEKEKD